MIQEAIIGGLANMLFSVNSCVNPFIYAQTIPAFKKIVLNLFLRLDGTKEERIQKNEIKKIREINMIFDE